LDSAQKLLEIVAICLAYRIAKLAKLSEMVASPDAHHWPCQLASQLIGKAITINQQEYATFRFALRRPRRLGALPIRDVKPARYVP